MDHMMPEMDGIETVQKIREPGGKYAKMTIIALTANAVKDAREMFLASGLNDFVSKPIDIEQLRDVVKRHLPPGKIIVSQVVKSVESQMESGFTEKLNQISEINTKIGLSRVSGIESMYCDTMEMFYKKSAAERDKMIMLLNKGDLSGFSITVHAIKSVLSTIGAMTLSGLAAELEDASKAGNGLFCNEKFPAFKEKLGVLQEQLAAVFPQEEKPAPEKKAGDKTFLLESVQKASEAADDFDGDAGLETMKALSDYDFGEEINELIEKTSAAFGDFDFSTAEETLNDIKEKAKLFIASL
jgi:CheY-like chemotaxis protein